MTVIYPVFKIIVKRCRQLIDQKYPAYRNSWLFTTAKSWWKRRLKVEINEIFKAKSSEELRKECCDAINLLSMMHDMADKFRYKK